MVAAGANPMAIKRGIEEAVDEAVDAIKGQAKGITGKEDIARVATISARNRGIGDIIADSIEKVGNCGRQELLKAIDLRLRLSEEAKKLFDQKAKTFQGDLSIISIFSLIHMFSIGGWSGYIEMTNPEGKIGRIDIKDAVLEKYTLDEQTGDEILQLLLSWTQGKFTAERIEKPAQIAGSVFTVDNTPMCPTRP